MATVPNGESQETYPRRANGIGVYASIGPPRMTRDLAQHPDEDRHHGTERRSACLTYHGIRLAHIHVSPGIETRGQRTRTEDVSRAPSFHLTQIGRLARRFAIRLFLPAGSARLAGGLPTPRRLDAYRAIRGKGAIDAEIDRFRIHCENSENVLSWIAPRT